MLEMQRDQGDIRFINLMQMPNRDIKPVLPFNYNPPPPHPQNNYPSIQVHNYYK